MSCNSPTRLHFHSFYISTINKKRHRRSHLYSSEQIMKFPRFQLARRKRVNVFLIKQCQATDYRQQLIANHPWDDTAKVVKRFDTSKYLIAFLQTTSKYQHKIEHLHRKRKIVRESRKVLHILHFFHFDFPFSFSLHFCHITFDIQRLAVKGQQRETSPYSPPMWFNDFS